MALRRFNKVPMVLLLVEAGIQIGLDMMCFKFAQVLLGEGYGSEAWIGITILALSGCVLALSNLHFINLSVKYYDATDVVPVLNAATMISEIGVGLIVGGEYKNYTDFELISIFLCSLICVAGIQVLVMKTSQMDLECDADDPIRKLSVPLNEGSEIRKISMKIKEPPSKTDLFQEEKTETRLKRFEPALLAMFLTPDEDKLHNSKESFTMAGTKSAGKNLLDTADYDSGDEILPS